MHIIGELEWLLLIAYIICVTGVCLIALYGWIEKSNLCIKLTAKVRKQENKILSQGNMLKGYELAYGKNEKFDGKHIDKGVLK